jgi:hypothetical protein
VLGTPVKAALHRPARDDFINRRKAPASCVAAETPIAGPTLADATALALRRADSENGCRGESMLTLVKVQIVQVPPEQRAQVNGATHACRHTADKLNNGEQVAAGKDFSGGMQTGDWAATCRTCAEYLRSRETTRTYLGASESAALWS